MELALLGYTVLNLTILGFVVLFVRAARARAAPNERPDLEENALIAADWELVRRERCLPSGCRRVRGQPPRPRKDVTCEVCAATFLEVRLQRLLELPSAPKSGPPELPHAREPMPGRDPVPCASALEGSLKSRPSLTSQPSAQTAAFAGQKCSSTTISARWALVRLGMGLVFVAAGGAFAAFGGLLGWIVPG